MSDKDTTKERKIFNVLVSHTEVMEGTVQVAAFDEKHAREVIADMFKDRGASFRIVDVYDIEDVEVPTKQQIDLPFEDKNTKNKETVH